MPIPTINAEENMRFTPSVKFSLGGVIGFLSAETSIYDWVGNNYFLAGGGSSVLVNWFSPTFNVMFLSSSDSGLHFGLGGNLTIALFGLFFTNDNLLHEGPLTGGSLAFYGIAGYNNFLLHIGYDFGTGSIYLSPNYMINRHLMVGLQISPFANNRRGLYSFLGLPPKERVNPPERFFRDSFFQVGLSIQYVF